MPKLSDLIHALPVAPLSRSGFADPDITGVVLDSRQVLAGHIFVALVGGSLDGHRYIPGAVQSGAAAVVGTRAAVEFAKLPVPYIQVADDRLSLAYLAAAYHGFPARQLTVIGVTGTDGKTTTANLIYQIMRTAGIQTGMITTINAVIGDAALDTGFHVTTPEAPDVQRYLAQMVAAGLSHVILETTSHGLAQHRVAACDYDIGVVTNITHEHLDYHGSIEAYRAAKARLFTGLAETPAKSHGCPRLAVLNADDGVYDSLRRLTSVRQVAYSLAPGADLYATDIVHDASGLHFMAVGPNFRQSVSSSLVGTFNVSNCLAALAVTVLGLGLDPAQAAAGIAGLQGVPGRMERIDLGQDFTAIVDFAHTPNALRRALEAVRPLTAGRVLVVFGSAGLRDRAKRRLMAEVAAELADLTYLTAEDPRTESLEEILAEMTGAACARGAVEGATVFRIPDRAAAIRQAVRAARSGDVVICCGKGHEQSMCFGDVEYPWDDRIALRSALAQQLGLPGPQMPLLPTNQE
ncbi:MAG TPA: UDP-N-acetylmuramoyl-L-alanyl-D-glutamate--2,6-diaminopimelate ligase [Anaerolineaceae bacterium]|nr:UDP-N-acetylmuramoyl-L-alanyl-D-glutamate--2,6-diaminopimelate ligase [Anaerolineaceae bacterium]